MVSKRQKIARKRFEAETGKKPTGEEKKPHLEVRQDSKKIVKKKKKNQAETGTGEETKPKKRIVKTKNGPLRLAGCFVCKSSDHTVKSCPKKESTKVCLQCRESGHTMKNCPSLGSQAERFCYNCGEKGHRLANCTRPLKDGGTTFAECFLCNEKGHISKNCTRNTNGIYPKGGSCKLCGNVTHLAKDCPNKAHSARVQISKDIAPIGTKRTVFKSGDDLEDDFGEL